MFKKIVLLIVGITINSQANAINLGDFVSEVLTDVISDAITTQQNDSSNRNMNDSDWEYWQSYSGDFEGLLGYNLPEGTNVYKRAESYVNQVSEQCNEFNKILLNTTDSRHRVLKQNYCITSDAITDYWNQNNGIALSHRSKEVELWEKVKKAKKEVEIWNVAESLNSENIPAQTLNLDSNAPASNLIEYEKYRARKAAVDNNQAIADLKQEQQSTPIVNGQWKRFDILTADHAVGVMSSDRKSVLAVTCTMGNLTAIIDWQIMVIPKTVIVAVDGYVSDKDWHNYKSTSNFDVELIKAMMNAKGNIVATAKTQRHTRKKQFFSPRGSTKMIAEVMEYCGY